MTIVHERLAPRLPRRRRRRVGGLSLGFHVPFAGEALRRPTAAPEINAWVVIQPDDTVVIRIARSEMGQGTLTGLAQLVAEELDCDWAQGHHRIPDARARTSRATASGAISPPAAAAASASRTTMSARAAPPRAMMLVQAAAAANGRCRPPNARSPRA